MPWVSARRLEAIEKIIKSQSDKIERLERDVRTLRYNVFYDNEELLPELMCAGESSRPNVTTIKSMLFDIMVILNLKAVYQPAVKPGYHLVAEKDDE